jgi:hypothetical protein
MSASPAKKRSLPYFFEDKAIPESGMRARTELDLGPDNLIDVAPGRTE